MVKIRKRVTLHLDRKTAELLATLCGSLDSGGGIGARLTPIFDELEKRGIYSGKYDDVRFSVDEAGEQITMYRRTLGLSPK